MARRSLRDRTKRDRTAEEAVARATRVLRELKATPRWVVGQPLESPSAWAFNVESDDPAGARFGLLIVDKRSSRVEQWLDTETDRWPEEYEEERARPAIPRPWIRPGKGLPLLLVLVGIVATIVVLAVVVPQVGGPVVLFAAAIALLVQPLLRLRWRWRFRRGLTSSEAHWLAVRIPPRAGVTPRTPVGEPLESASVFAFHVETPDPMAAEAFGLLTVDRHDGWIEQLPAGIPESEWADRAQRRRAERLARTDAAWRNERRFRFVLVAIEVALVVGLFLVLWLASSDIPGWVAGALAFLLVLVLQAIPGAHQGVREDYRKQRLLRRRIALEPSPTHRSHRVPPRGGDRLARDLLEPLPIRRI